MSQQVFADNGNPDMGAVDVGVTGDKDNVWLVPSKRFDFLYCCRDKHNRIIGHFNVILEEVDSMVKREEGFSSLYTHATRQAAGVKVDAQGFTVVNEGLETTAADIETFVMP